LEKIEAGSYIDEQDVAKTGIILISVTWDEEYYIRSHPCLETLDVKTR